MSWSRFIHRRQWDDERARELEANLEIETDENIARGMSPEEARYAARRKLGNLTLIREEIYGMNSLGWLETIWQDLRYGVRTLAKNPGFTAVAVLTLALGIGANTAIFTLVDAVMFKSLPVANPQELYRVRNDDNFFGDTLRPDPPDFWLSLSTEPALNGQNSVLNHADEHWLCIIGRLKPGAQPASVQSELTAEVQHWQGAQPDLTADNRSELGKQHIVLAPGGGGVALLQADSATGLRLLLATPRARSKRGESWWAWVELNYRPSRFIGTL